MGRGMTERLFLRDPTARGMRALVLAAGPEGVVLDRTVFYARSGGQPGDIGLLRWDGGTMMVADTIKGEGEAILHLPGDSLLPAVGAEITGEIDWERRHKMMRAHTSMHL